MFDYNLLKKQLSNKNTNSISFIKNEIAKRLLKRLEFMNISPKNILLKGYYDDDFLQILKNKFPNTNITTNIMENSTFDMIISNTEIHLNKSIIDILELYHSYLNNDGILLFSSFGDKNLNNVTKVFNKFDNYVHVNSMIDLLTWGNTLQQQKIWQNPAVESDQFKLTYEKLDTFFNDIKELNEPLADTKMKKSLTGKNIWKNICNELLKDLYINIEAIYGYALKFEKNQEIKKSNNTHRVSLDDLKQQILDFNKN